MKKGIKLFFVFLIILVALFAITEAIFTPTIPPSCSNTDINAIWDSVFKETSSGITIFPNTTINNRCNGYLAYKVQGDRIDILTGIEVPSASTNFTYITAYEGNFTQDYINIVKNFSAVQNYSTVSNHLSFSNLQTYTKQRINNVSSSSDASINFSSIFEATPGTLDFATSSGINYYLYSQTESNSTEGKVLNGTVIGNYSLSYLSYISNYTPLLSCTSNWVALNTSCLSDDSYIVWYNDTNSCSGTTRPSNITKSCDYNNNGIIGNLSSSILSSIALDFYIDSSLANLSLIYNTTKLVELREGNTTRVSFNYPFSLPLNFKAINISKQPSSSSYGYLVVNGINATKTFTIDKISASSNLICILNAEASISDISTGCNSTREFVVSCPGTFGSYACALAGNQFIVSGLTNSVVYEYTGARASCTENWTCLNWTACASGKRTRTCTDSKNCGTTTNRPTLNETCTVSTICQTNWTCSPWPTKCPSNGIQTRTCIDTKKCLSPLDTPRPALSQSCTNQSNWTIIIVITSIILFLIIAIIYFIIKSKPSGDDRNYINVQNFPRGPPATPQFPQQPQRTFQPQIQPRPAGTNPPTQPQPKPIQPQPRPAQPSPGMFNPRPAGTNPTPQQPQRTLPGTGQPNQQNSNDNPEKKVDFEF